MKKTSLEQEADRLDQIIITDNLYEDDDGYDDELFDLDIEDGNAWGE